MRGNYLAIFACCCFCSHNNSHNQVRGHRTAPVTLELRNTPGKNTNNSRLYTHISQLTQFMPPPETYGSEIGSQCCCCSHINSYNQVRGHRTGSSYSGAEEYPREKHTQPKVVHPYITVYHVPGPYRCIRLTTHAWRWRYDSVI